MKSPILLLLVASLPNLATAQVDLSSELETIATEFGLADGPPWDGSGSLYIPDVTGGRLLRYYAKTDKMEVVLPQADRISASFFNHGKLFLSDNGASRIARLAGKSKTLITAHDRK